MKESPRKTGIKEHPKATLRKIGSKLKKLRKAAGYNNSDAFSYDHNINRSQYGKYEVGAKDMRISSLLKTVNALGITLEDFFRDGLD
jgi:hypothetical protein